MIDLLEVEDNLLSTIHSSLNLYSICKEFLAGLMDLRK